MMYQKFPRKAHYAIQSYEVKEYRVLITFDKIRKHRILLENGLWVEVLVRLKTGKVWRSSLGRKKLSFKEILGSNMAWMRLPNSWQDWKGFFNGLREGGNGSFSINYFSFQPENRLLLATSDGFRFVLHYDELSQALLLRKQIALGTFEMPESKKGNHAVK